MEQYNFDEDITEGEAKDAVTGGKYPIGKFLCRVTNRTIIPMEKMTPPCYGQSFEMTVRECLEFEKKVTTDKNRHEFDGTVFTDEVGMPTPGEKEWVKKKRTAIAVALKHIPPTGGKMTGEKWEKSLGRDVVIETAPTKRKNDVTGKWEDTDFIAVKMYGGWSMADTPPPAVDVGVI